MAASPQSPAAQERPRIPDRAAGLALFLPVPLVLWLLTRAPLGVPASLAVATAVMLTHRPIARPFALARARRRCLWCGGPAGDGPAFAVREPGASSTWRACSDRHARHCAATLGWADRRRSALRVVIVGAVAGMLVAGLLAGWGRLGPVGFADVSAGFRLVIAGAVLPLGLLAPRAPGELAEVRAPFPVHLQALVGTRWVLWLFRLVGLYWLVDSALHFAGLRR